VLNAEKTCSLKQENMQQKTTLGTQKHAKQTNKHAACAKRGINMQPVPTAGKCAQAKSRLVVLKKKKTAP